MKTIFTILFLTSSILINATKYYVSPRGNDSNSGADTSSTGAWKTWQKGFNSTPASDTCYFLSGTYPAYSTAIGASLHSTANSGTRTSPTCFFAYDISGGDYPILDCSIVEAANQIGVSIAGVSFMHFKGLEVRNVRQLVGGLPSYGWLVWNYGNVVGDAPNNLTFENCIASYNGGFGFTVTGVDSIYYINCDSHHNSDPYTPDDPGGMGNGYVIEASSYENYSDAYISYKGCRAWDNSDQGWGIWSPPTAVWDSCWAVHNGFLRTAGDDPNKGTGWKLWFRDSEDRNTGVRQITIRNCLAVDNELRGFSMADDPGNHPEVRVWFTNNFAYRNGHEHEYPVNPLLYGHGFWDYTNVDTIGRFDHWYYNNISYNNSGYPTGSGDRIYGDFIPGAYNQATNKFDLATTTITDDDFVSLDTTGLTGPRQPDGSLPFTTFGHLASTSECVDAGTDVGLPYNGSAPDVGWVEYDGPAMGIIGAIGKTVVVSSYIASVGLDASGTISNGGPIIADHTVVDKYNDIPQRWIDSVKTMWVSIAGESHSLAYRTGAQLLENQNSKFAVSIRESGTPDPYTTNNLRLSRATWGDLNNSSGWIYGYGEEDWYTSTTAINRTKAGLDYCNNNGPVLAALGFGWCWDPDEQVEAMDVYNEVTQEYDEYCRTNDYLTKVFFTTGPVDATNASGIVGYYKYLAYEAIRNYVSQIDNAVLFDYADILCYDDDGTGPNTASYNGNVFPIITQDNVSPEQTGHISNTGALRLGKALWWMLARIAGWDGN